MSILCRSDVEVRRRYIRSTSSSSLVVRHTHLSTIGDLAFPVAASFPAVEHSAPQDVTSARATRRFQQTRLVSRSFFCEVKPARPSLRTPQSLFLIICEWWEVWLNFKLHLSVSGIEDIRRTIVSVIGSHFPSSEDHVAVHSASVAEPNDRLTGEQFCQFVHQSLVCSVIATYGRLTPSSCLGGRRLIS